MEECCGRNFNRWAQLLDLILGVEGGTNSMVEMKLLRSHFQCLLFQDLHRLMDPVEGLGIEAYCYAGAEVDH